ncbi:MAG: hypothetical protein ACW967_00540 [Candidatus Hodarchaeales archaeon]|jgi:hypothetical protein
MIAYAAYVISIDGRPFVSVKFQSAISIPDDLLLGGLFTALQAVTSELTSQKSELNSIIIENLSYHFKSFGDFRIVLVTNLQEEPTNLMHMLGLRFLKEYGEQIIDLGVFDESDFVHFKLVMKELISRDLSIDESSTINPSIKFTTGEIYGLESAIRPTALALISLREGTVNQIAKESGLDEEITNNNLDHLQEKGLVGKKNHKGEIKFFCSF